jgi:hypothetical protein
LCWISITNYNKKKKKLKILSFKSKWFSRISKNKSKVKKELRKVKNNLQIKKKKKKKKKLMKRNFLIFISKKLIWMK